MSTLYIRLLPKYNFSQPLSTLLPQQNNEFILHSPAAPATHHKFRLYSQKKFPPIANNKRHSPLRIRVKGNVKWGAGHHTQTKPCREDFWGRRAASPKNSTITQLHTIPTKNQNRHCQSQTYQSQSRVRGCRRLRVLLLQLRQRLLHQQRLHLRQRPQGPSCWL